MFVVKVLGSGRSGLIRYIVSKTDSASIGSVAVGMMLYMMKDSIVVLVGQQILPPSKRTPIEILNQDP